MTNPPINLNFPGVTVTASAPGVFCNDVGRFLNAAAPRAIASATPGAMRSKVGAGPPLSHWRSRWRFAGAAVVRSWRTDADWRGRQANPLKRGVRYPCTRSPNFRLSPRKTAPARGPRGSSHSNPQPVANPSSRKHATVPGNPVDEMCKVTNTAPRCALAVAERSSNEGFSFPCPRLHHLKALQLQGARRT